MWVLALAFDLCLDTQPGCVPQYIYSASFKTSAECFARIRPEDEALGCVGPDGVWRHADVK